MLAALALCAWAGCGDDKHDDKPAAPAASASASGSADAPVDLAAHCGPLASTCGDTDKHIAKLLEECTATAQQGQRCATEAAAVYDCYQQQLCGKDDKVWTLDDLRKLAERHGKCAGERQALRVCAAK